MYFTYLIPWRFTGNGEIALEYRTEVHKMDMRTRFCKTHETHRITSWVDVEALPSFSKMALKGDRLIAPDGKTAAAFQAELEAHIAPVGANRYKAVPKRS